MGLQHTFMSKMYSTLHQVIDLKSFLFIIGHHQSYYGCIKLNFLLRCSILKSCISGIFMSKIHRVCYSTIMKRLIVNVKLQQW